MAAGVVIPAACFLIGFPERPYWQSGDHCDYAQLLLGRLGCVPLYPFLLYSMVCLTLLAGGPGSRTWATEGRNSV